MGNALQLVLLLASSLVLGSPSSLLGQQLQRRDPPTCTVSAISPPPKGYICGGQGKINHPSPIDTGTAATQEECSENCLNSEVKCVSFSYGPDDQCILYNKRILGSSFHRGTTGRRFWNRHCYKKTCVCPDGQSRCNGDCVDKQTDQNNCGKCGTACDSNSFCSAGSCTCKASATQCSPQGPCIDLTSDPENCGTCGNVCPSGACYHSMCSDCSMDYCQVEGDSPCGDVQGCTCFGIDGSDTYGACTPFPPLSCADLSPCDTASDCPPDNLCVDRGHYCACSGRGCLPYANICTNNSAPSKIFRVAFRSGWKKPLSGDN